MSEKEENPADYGHAKKAGPVKGIPTHALKKDIKAGKVLTGDDANTSVDTPDPNVTSLGDTTDTRTSGTVTGDANTTRTTPRNTSGTGGGITSRSTTTPTKS